MICLLLRLATVWWRQSLLGAPKIILPPNLTHIYAIWYNIFNIFFFELQTEWQ